MDKPNQGAWLGRTIDKPNQGAWLYQAAAATGWTHIFLGVANANISKINRIEKSNIAKVMGV